MPYTKTIRCVNGFIDFLPTHVKQDATELTIIDTSMKPIYSLELSQYSDLKVLNLEIPSKDALCPWIKVQEIKYKNIEIITTPHDLCAHVRKSDRADDDVTNKMGSGVDSALSPRDFGIITGIVLGTCLLLFCIKGLM